jgi:hypothetical protein
LSRALAHLGRAGPRGVAAGQARQPDHDVCRPAGTKWVEGICSDAADYWPAKVLGTLLNCALYNKRVTMVHPNVEGHANTAAHVERAIRIACLSN